VSQNDGRRCGVDAQIARVPDIPTNQPETPRKFSEQRYPLQRLTGRIIAASYVVHRTFGFGYLEAVYRRALAVELRYQGILVAEEVPYELFHRGVSVGYYRADLVVDSRVIVETKTGRVLEPSAPAQLLNNVRAAGLSVGLVVHFGLSVKTKRIVVSSPERLGSVSTEIPEPLEDR
jgi:GxxExxY protein